MSLNKNSPISLHIQVRNELRSWITSEQVRAGDRLPSEREMRAMYGVSRITLRSALDDLERSGLIYSRPGKGWFISSLFLDQQLKHLSGFSQDIYSTGMRPSSNVLIQEAQVVTPMVANELQVPRGTRIARIRRVRTADGVPMAIEDASFPLSSCPDILDQDFAQGSIYSYLESRGLKLTKAIQTLTCDLATADERRLLGLISGIPVMRMKRRTYLVDQRVIEYVESAYRADRYQFTASLSIGENAAMSIQAQGAKTLE